MTESNCMKTFGINVRSVLNARQELAQDLAARIGMHPAYLSTILSGRQNTTGQTMELIANALDLPLHELLNPKFQFRQMIT